MNIPTIESRVAVLEAIIEQINHRLNSIDNRLSNMDNRFTNVENRINSNFKWIVGLLVTVLLGQYRNGYHHHFDAEQILAVRF